MPVVQFEGKDGYAIKVEDVDGYYLPVLPTEKTTRMHLADIENLDVREDDVFLVGYPKCGTHWVWEMVGMLQKGHSQHERRNKGSSMIDFVPKEQIDSLESPRILNSHMHFRFLPNQILTKKAKIILLVRNPKDVSVSFYNHVHGMNEISVFNGKYSSFLELFLEGKVFYGSWFEYMLDWEKQIAKHPELPVCILHYEELKKDPQKWVKHLANFLGVDADDELCCNIAEACSFQKLKQAHHELKEDPFRDAWKKDSKGIYRKGEVGDWKNWITVADNEIFDRLWEEKMKDSSFYKSVHLQ